MAKKQKISGLLSHADAGGFGGGVSGVIGGKLSVHPDIGADAIGALGRGKPAEFLLGVLQATGGKLERGPKLGTQPFMPKEGMAPA